MFVAPFSQDWPAPDTRNRLTQAPRARSRCITVANVKHWLGYRPVNPACEAAPMNVFELRKRLIGDYSAYVGGFIEIRDPRIGEHVERSLDAGELWPEPLIQLN